MMKRAFALWYGTKQMPVEMRIYYFANVALLVLMLLVAIFFALPGGNRTYLDQPQTYGQSVLGVMPLLIALIGGLIYTCDALVWKRRGSRTALFLSTTSALLLFGSALTPVGSLLGLIYGLIRVRRYMFYAAEVDEYYGRSTEALSGRHDA
jgi:hypothetical protein